jgi:cyanophycinase
VLIAILTTSTGTGIEEPRGADEAPRGRLVLHGGGQTNTDFRRRVLELAGGPDANVLVLPQATTLDDVNDVLPALWREAGATRPVELLDLADHAAATRQVEAADLIWITSGNQNRLMSALTGTGVAEAIARRFRAGALVGGVSAGAAVMSGVMITGDPIDPKTGRTPTARGLDLWPGVVVDQHVLARDRLQRLEKALPPSLIGVGIDERTWVEVEPGGRKFKVSGTSLVVVIDPSRGAEGRLVRLGPGASYDLGGGVGGDPPTGEARPVP